VIVGGGVVGCALAWKLAGKYSDVFLLEQMPKLAMGTSSRNSGVLHAGLYYTPGSLKARHCVEGNRLTMEFCAAHGVPFRRTGKLVVASKTQEEPQLEALLQRAEQNGVRGLRIIDRQEIRAREPYVEGSAALEVPSTGIVMSEELVKAYARLARELGASVLTSAKVERIEPGRETIRVASALGEIETRCLVNCAGLFADEVAALAGNHRYRIYPVRGEYCEAVPAKSHLVRALVYPLPHAHGLSLGVHLTKTLWGTLLVGPTARYIESKTDYESDRQPAVEFARSARRLLPDLKDEDVVLAYSGIRAKLAPPPAPANAPAQDTAATGKPAAGTDTKMEAAPDFVIERDPACPAIIHMVGIESPGLTAAISLADYVAGMVAETLR
jgi:glycerol-3-phosphate dehydrogenase